MDATKISIFFLGLFLQTFTHIITGAKSLECGCDCPAEGFVGGSCGYPFSVPFPQPVPVKVPVPCRPPPSVTIPNIIVALLPPTPKVPVGKPCLRPQPPQPQPQPQPPRPQPCIIPIPQPYPVTIPDCGCA